MYISIHALRVEGDCYPSSTRDCRDLFLSTPSGWRATRPRQLLQPEAKFLSTPSGWRATGKRDNIRPARQIFLSTPSGWRATAAVITSAFWPAISIHALRVEGDLCTKPIKTCRTGYFYPRPPGGGRQQKRTKFSSVFAQKGEEFASLRREKREFAGGVLKRTNFGF